jgi:hypothetical protein
MCFPALEGGGWEVGSEGGEQICCKPQIICDIVNGQGSYILTEWGEKKIRLSTSPLLKGAPPLLLKNNLVALF